VLPGQRTRLAMLGRLSGWRRFLSTVLQAHQEEHLLFPHLCSASVNLDLSAGLNPDETMTERLGIL
jgi:hypothetical protein